MPSLNETLFARFQYCLPQHVLSRLSGKVMGCQYPVVKNALIRWFVQRYQVDMRDAVEADPLAYEHFNQFFTRPLKPEARPLATGDDALLCPADGALSQYGAIHDDRIIQAKDHDYSIAALLGSAQRAESFRDGTFATVYLSPKDYHRLHMPITGTLTEMVYIPGRLFSVNQATTAVIPGLFARNERVVAMFETAIGPMALVLVGAIFVASIETVWHGLVTPPAGSDMRIWHYSGSTAQTLARGEEMGRFKLGSTIVALFPKDRVSWDAALSSGCAVRMGQGLGALV